MLRYCLPSLRLLLVSVATLMLACAGQDVTSGDPMSAAGLGSLSSALASAPNGYLVAAANSGDDRGTNVTGDWSPGQYKSEGGPRSVLSGVAERGIGFSGRAATTELFKAEFSSYNHFVSAYTSSGTCYRRDFGQYDNRYLQSGDDPIAFSDWDRGYYKAQCGKNEYVAGLGHNTSSGQINSMLCCFHDSTVRTRSSCSVSYVGGASESNSAGAWTDFSGRAQCGNSRYVAGVSKYPSGTQGFAVNVHAILCCN
jgi:hypothetical protein